MTSLLATAGLSALVGTRIHWDLAPQGTGLPFVVLTLVSSRPMYVHGGRAGLTPHLVQLDAYAETKAAAKEVSRALADAVEALGPPTFQKAFVETERSGLDAGAGRAADQAATPLHRASLDVRVWRPDS